ncbi:MAG: anhydro-N-acetylmuramic acid kinase [Bacteroidetes bacterium]|nr:MAG: anhydro-N-acetylmuramic acid kinase [Bacteroidota bacterium]
MNILEKLSRKKTKIVIGLMSGTSADGIDTALVTIKKSGLNTKVKLKEFHTFPYPAGFKQFLLRNSQAETTRIDDIARLNFLIGEFFADAAIAICKKAKIPLSDVDLIGSHGQTIHHLPQKKKIFGKKIRATIQIGEPAVIAKRTGVVTVGDFRVADIAVGGSGAPLVPYIDYLLFRSDKLNRALLNIGGIANVTALSAGCSVDDVFAFDTGPGNMVIDSLMNYYFNLPYDKNGKVASKGKILPELLWWMLSHSYISKKPPKSTGREVFGETFVNEILLRAKKESREDIIATVTEFTALSIFQNYVYFIKKLCNVDELIVSGGGVHNSYLMNTLMKYFEGVNVFRIDDFGLSSDAKEAVAFAILANETISGNAGNMVQATGAERRTVLGKVCFGN